MEANSPIPMANTEIIKVRNKKVLRINLDENP
jgi:hypothetical protein